MELDEMRSTWHALERSLLQQQRAMDFLVRDARVGAARARLHAFAWIRVVPIVLGIALVALGVATWNRSGVAALPFACGIALHLFGVVTIAWAGATIARVAAIDYAAPVLAIQQRLAALERFEAIGVVVCGLPWWFMWAVVMAALLSLVGVSFDDGSMSLWFASSIGTGIAGFAATWLGYVWAQRSGRPALAAALRKLVVGAGVRRARDEIDALRRFESEA
jgi:hypothetical protein